MAKVKLLNYDDLVATGLFTLQEIEGVKKRQDGYIGTKGGVMYYRSDVEIDLGYLEGTGAPGEIADMQGEGRNRQGPNMPARE